MLRIKQGLYIIVVTTVGVLLFSSCKKEKVVITPEMGYNYFPFHVGHWVTYKVDSIHYNDFTTKSDTSHFLVKEYYESMFNDLSGRPTIRIERHRKDNDTTNWYIKDVWYANCNAFAAEKIEENVRFVKLIFAVEKEKKWNGNVYNTLVSQTYNYKNVDEAYNINNLMFDSTLTVMQKDVQTLISSDYQKEVFARNIGLIYKKFVQLKRKIDGTIISGTDYTYTIVSWGN